MNMSTMYNRDTLERTGHGHCGHCVKKVRTSEILDWVDGDTGTTALCPHCGIDAILPQVTLADAQAYHDEYFTGGTVLDPDDFGFTGEEWGY